MNWLPAAPHPKILVLPLAAADLGEAEAAIEQWEHYSRKTLDDTQRLTVQVMMAQADGGQWAAATTGREMPRQNGKGDEIEVVELWGLVQRSEAILHTVHDAVLLASQAQQRMLGVLEGHADLRRRVKRKWQGTGQQMIEMTNGGVIWYRTRTGGGGRGVDDVDRLVVDEAQHATEEQLAAVSPTLLANKNPQLNAMGTAGLAGRSEWWWRVRRRALSDDPGSFGYIGHTAESVRLDDDGRVVQEPVDALDRSLWGPCNPALASGRGVGIDFLDEQLRRLGPESFAREHLGVWDPPEETGIRETIVDLAAWSALHDDPADRPSPVALGVEVSHDRKWTTIGLAGIRSDGRRYIQVVQAGRGTGWVPDRLAELQQTWKPTGVALVTSGPAGSLLAELEQRRIRHLVTMSKADDGKACGMFVDAVNEATITHDDGRLLRISLEGATRHRSGDAWTIAPPADGSTDVSPLQACKNALYALAKNPKPNRPGGRRAVVLS